jgi:hypothetical protein
MKTSNLMRLHLSAPSCVFIFFTSILDSIQVWTSTCVGLAIIQLRYLIAVNNSQIKTTVLWDVKPCSLTDIYRSFGGKWCPWNVSKYIQDYAASHPEDSNLYTRYIVLNISWVDKLKEEKSCKLNVSHKAFLRIIYRLHNSITTFKKSITHLCL